MKEVVLVWIWDHEIGDYSLEAVCENMENFKKIRKKYYSEVEDIDICYEKWEVL